MSERTVAHEERLDAYYRLVAYVFLGIGTVHAVGALREVLAPDSPAHAVATMVGRAFLVIVPVLCAWTIWRAITFKTRLGWGCSLGAGGFVLEAIQRAAVTAGLVTYVTLAVMHVASDDTVLSVKFYLNGAMAIMTLTFAVGYLVRTSVSVDSE